MRLCLFPLAAKNEMEAERESSAEYQCQELQQAITNQSSFCIQGYSFVPTGGAVYLLFFHDSLSLVMNQQEGNLLFLSSVLIYTYQDFISLYIIIVPDFA